MKWELAIVAAAVLAVAGVSRRLADTPFTPAMAFVLIGLLMGPLVIDGVTSAPRSRTRPHAGRGDAGGGAVRGCLTD